MITVIGSRRVSSRKFLRREEEAVISPSPPRQDEHRFQEFTACDFIPAFPLRQIVALREQNAHIQRKVASGEGGDDLLEGGDSQQKLHSKVSLSSCFLGRVALLLPRSWKWRMKTNEEYDPSFGFLCLYTFHKDSAVA